MRFVRQHAGVFGTLVEHQRGPVGMHGGGIVEPLNLRVSTVKTARPGTSHRARPAHQCHGGTGAGRKDTGQVEHLRSLGQAQPQQPGLTILAMDDPGLLEYLGQAGSRALRQVHDRLFLQAGLGALVVVEACVGGSVVTKIVPTHGVGAGAKVDPPQQGTGRQGAQRRRQRRQPLRVRFPRELGGHCGSVVTTAGRWRSPAPDRDRIAAMPVDSAPPPRTPVPGPACCTSATGTPDPDLRTVPR